MYIQLGSYQAVPVSCEKIYPQKSSVIFDMPTRLDLWAHFVCLIDCYVINKSEHAVLHCKCELSAVQWAWRGVLILVCVVYPVTKWSHSQQDTKKTYIPRVKNFVNSEGHFADGCWENNNAWVDTFFHINQCGHRLRPHHAHMLCLNQSLPWGGTESFVIIECGQALFSNAPVWRCRTKAFKGV